MTGSEMERSPQPFLVLLNYKNQYLRVTVQDKVLIQGMSPPTRVRLGARGLMSRPKATYLWSSLQDVIRFC